MKKGQVVIYTGHISWLYGERLVFLKKLWSPYGIKHLAKEHYYFHVEGTKNIVIADNETFYPVRK